jgi:hypothetical protein
VGFHTFDSLFLQTTTRGDDPISHRPSCELDQLSFDHNVVELHAHTFHMCAFIPKNGLDNGALLHESKDEWIWLSLQ